MLDDSRGPKPLETPLRGLYAHLEIDKHYAKQKNLPNCQFWQVERLDTRLFHAACHVKS